jgi:hypothetical protein
MRSLVTFVAGIVFVLASAAAQAEVKVAVECNHGDDATPQFKFKKVPGPVDNDAARNAKFNIVDGTADGNGGDASVTHDGKLPEEEDQPSRNFFFNEGDDGGRLSIDLGKAIEIKQVNTFSWHPNTRGPQVYKLYAADGAAKDFNAEPKKDADPAKCGWKLIASVDTRPAGGDPGGQYGVSIADSAGPIGKYRYLLFDISQTEKDDAWGNTFFSRINVIKADGKKQSRAKAPAGRLMTQSPDSAKYRITIEYADAPELAEWVEDKLQPTCDEWYPKIIKALPSKDYTPPRRVFIVITDNYRGVAATGDNHVSCSASWFKRNIDGEAPGAVVHELVHVAQQYRDSRGGESNPVWLVEGIADYIRWFKYEPRPTGTRPRNPETANYTDSYRTTAGFLNYVVQKHDKQLVVKLNAAMRQGRYSSYVWKESTGKTVDDLWKEYVATLR